MAGILDRMPMLKINKVYSKSFIVAEPWTYPQFLCITLCLDCQPPQTPRPTPNVQKMTNPLQT